MQAALSRSASKSTSSVATVCSNGLDPSVWPCSAEAAIQRLRGEAAAGFDRADNKKSGRINREPRFVLLSGRCTKPATSLHVRQDTLCHFSLLCLLLSLPPGGQTFHQQWRSLNVGWQEREGRRSSSATGWGGQISSPTVRPGCGKTCTAKPATGPLAFPEVQFSLRAPRASSIKSRNADKARGSLPPGQAWAGQTGAAWLTQHYFQPFTAPTALLPSSRIMCIALESRDELARFRWSSSSRKGATETEARQRRWPWPTCSTSWAIQPSTARQPIGPLWARGF